MNARFYSPSSGRFITADTLIPNPANPQADNRYTYSLNSPLRFTDPTGHRECGQRDLDCDNPLPHEITGSLVSFRRDDTWLAAEKATFQDGAMQLAQALFEVAGDKYNSPREVFRAVYGGAVEIRRIGKSCAEAFDNSTYTCYASASAHHINIYTNADGHIEGYTMWVMHELFHSFNGNAIPAGETAGQPYLDLTANPIKVGDETISPANGLPRTHDGYRWGEGGAGDETPYVNSWDNYGVGEDFADMGANWAAKSFASDDYGAARYNWMDGRMQGWIALAVAHNQ